MGAARYAHAGLALSLVRIERPIVRQVELQPGQAEHLAEQQLGRALHHQLQGPLNIQFLPDDLLYRLGEPRCEELRLERVTVHEIAERRGARDHGVVGCPAPASAAEG